MAGQQNLDELFYALSRAPANLVIQKAAIANQAAGALCSLFRAGGLPVAPSIPGAWAICTDATAGSLGAIQAPGVGERALLTLFSVLSATATTLVVVDRLGHMGGLSGAVASPTAQAVNASVVSLAGTRCRADYADVRWGFEIYTDIGTTAATATVDYTDAGGTARTLTQSIGGASPLNRAGRVVEIVQPAANPLPIRSIENVTLNISTGTAGSFGVTAWVRKSPDIGCAAGVSRELDWAQLGAPEVPSACLALLAFCTTTASPVLSSGIARVGVG